MIDESFVLSIEPNPVFNEACFQPSLHFEKQ